MGGSVQSAAYKRFIRLLVEARQAGGLSQKQLADRLGRPQSFVAKYELRERRLDIVEFLEIAASLSVDPVEIVHEIEQARADSRGS